MHRSSWFGGVAAATPPTQAERCKAQIIRSLMMVIKPKHVGAVLM
jgi:hypothetical protein